MRWTKNRGVMSMANMANKLVVICIIVAILGLGGCAKNTIDSPCPNFGKSCSKTPINSWNYNN